MQNIILSIRDLIEDNAKSTIDVFEFISSKVFTLSEANVDSTSILVYKSGTLVANTNYTFNTTNSKLTFNNAYSLTAGDSIELDYSAYIKYSDEELKGYIRAALARISVEKYKTFKDRTGYIFPTPNSIEENLIAVVASILIKKSISQYRTSEININYVETESIDEKIRKTVGKFKSYLGVLDFHQLNSSEDNCDE